MEEALRFEEERHESLSSHCGCKEALWALEEASKGLIAGVRECQAVKEGMGTSAKINISYSILFNLTTFYSSYFGGKKGISRNK